MNAIVERFRSGRRWQDRAVRCLWPATTDDVTYDDLIGLYDFPAATGRREHWVRAIFISSMDGAAQGPDRRSGSLSSNADREVFALQRSLCDVILVGASTSRVEGYRPVQPSEVDQRLRKRVGLSPLPAIAVVSRSLALDPGLVGGPDRRTLVLTSRSAPSQLRAEIEETTDVIVTGDDRVDLPAALSELARRGFRRVLCEGGPTLMADLVIEGCIDELCLTLSPQLLGGDHRRILHGPPLLPTRTLTLAHLLGEGDELFARYLVEPAAGGAEGQ
jgi:riboflavin biosynthesis pyrimidine reductase